MNKPKTFYDVNPRQDLLDKLALSEEEAKNLNLKDIRCPYCDFLVDRVFSDVMGHKVMYCKKCKREYIMNLGYFRRKKPKKREFIPLFEFGVKQNR